MMVDVTDEKLLEVMALFCSWVPEPEKGYEAVWGNDTELFENPQEALKAMKEILLKRGVK